MLTSIARGRAIADQLAGSWRQSPTPSAHSELTTLAPLLVETGAGALAWWRIRSCPAGNSSFARPLRQAFRNQALQALNQREHLQEAFTRLRRAGIEPLLVKGAALARHYADPGLRPSGDIDLCIPPEQLATAIDILNEAKDTCGPIDLHGSVADLDCRDWKEIWARSQLFAVGDMKVRGLGAEDQLRHTCLHLLRHEAWRPLWLCDVAATLEALPTDFDWGYCLHGKRRLTDWVLCIIGLAHRLLEARLDDAAIARRADRAPDWIEETVLQLWSLGKSANDGIGTMSSLPRTLAGLWQSIRRRWPNPIRATFNQGLGPFHHLPNRAVQAGYYLRRGLRFLGQIPHWFRNKRSEKTLSFDLHPIA